MGCWSENCAISGMEIRDGQEVYAFTVSRDPKNCEGYGAAIIHPPIKGTYNDYGAIDLTEDNSLFDLKAGEEWSPHREDYPADTDYHLVFIDAEVFDWLYSMEPEWTYGMAEKTIGTQVDKALNKIRTLIAALETDAEVEVREGMMLPASRAVTIMSDLFGDYRGYPFKDSWTYAWDLIDKKADMEEYLKFFGRASVISRAFMELRKTIPIFKTYAPQHGGEQALIPFYNFVLKTARKRRHEIEAENIMEIEDIIERKAALDLHVKENIDLLKDTSIDLDTRWDQYKQLCEADLITEIDSYGDGHVDILFGAGKGSPYDDFNLERHETGDYLELLVHIEEKVQEVKDGVEWAEERWAEVTDEKIAAWKEKVLESGKAGFVYDW